MRYLERALGSPPPRRSEVTYELGRALWGASPIEAPEVLVSVAERTEDPELRLRALEDAAWTYFDAGNLERAVHWLGRLVEAIPADRPELMLPAEASLPALATRTRPPPGGPRRGSRRVAAEAGAATRGELLVRQALSFDRFLGCSPVEEVVELAASFPPPPWAGRARCQGIATKVLAWSGSGSGPRGDRSGLGERALEGLVHVASYRESMLAEIDRLGEGWSIPSRRPAPPGTSSGTSRRYRCRPGRRPATC